MRLPPITILITWPLPNYVDPVTRSTALLVTTSIFVGLMLLAVALRFYARIKFRKFHGADDTFISLATIFAIGLYVVVVIGNRSFGWDRHAWDIPPSKVPGANIIAFVAKLVFTFAATFTRISLLCIYYRLVEDSGIRWFRWALHLTLAYIIAIMVTFVLLVIFQCIPVQAYWVFPPMADAKCMDEGTITVTAGVLNCVSDFVVASLPVPIVMQLRMPLKRRIGVCVLLGLGYVVTVAGIVRTYFIYRSLVATYDESWYSYPLWIAAAVEIDLAVICACAPAIHGLVRKTATQLSARYSARLSSNLTPQEYKPPSSSNQDSSQPSSSGPSKKSSSRFNPLRSLSLFDSIIDLEPSTQTQTENDEWPLKNVDKNGVPTPVATPANDPSALEKQSLKDGVHVVDWDDPASDTLSIQQHQPLRIMRTQTFEQATTYSGTADDRERGPRPPPAWSPDRRSPHLRSDGV